MARVFISFVHEDQPVAEAVQSYLAKELKLGADVFLSSDQTQVIAGEDWFARVRTELQSAEVVVVLMSQRSVSRPWVNFEVGAAWLADKAIIFACYGNMTADKLPKPYATLQALNLRDQQPYLLTSAGKHLGIRIPSLVERVLDLDKRMREPRGTFQQIADTLTIENALANFRDEEEPK